MQRLRAFLAGCKRRRRAAPESAREDDHDDRAMPLLDHLIELRRRLLVCVAVLLVLFVACYFAAEQIFAFLTRPLARVLLSADDDSRRMIFTGLPEVFFTHLKLAFFFACFLSCPLILTQIWRFVAPGLFRRERRAFLPFIAATPPLFFLGAAVVYFLIFPLAARFFVGFETPGGAGSLPIVLESRVSEYLSLMMRLIFAFGLCFQLPVLMALVVRAGLASARDLASFRRYAIVAVFVVAAIFTPPDPISQLGLALPMIVLYEVSVHIARWVERRQRRAEAAAEAETQGDSQA